ncbi:hypothetical protein EJ08DRAFT_733126 [Tothia fuscella]|uniref:Uncharacterized protein n=1 Tax=Tothia fuscella TaxID=1048955 RepID=A0A9P4NT93_9PEZI|nr:hypothetical protein EJ08DRAFT_733126 [Tothia fuscella]
MVPGILNQPLLTRNSAQDLSSKMDFLRNNCITAALIKKRKQVVEPTSSQSLQSDDSNLTIREHSSSEKRQKVDNSLSAIPHFAIASPQPTVGVPQNEQHLSEPERNITSNANLSRRERRRQNRRLDPHSIRKNPIPRPTAPKPRADGRKFLSNGELQKTFRTAQLSEAAQKRINAANAVKRRTATISITLPLELKLLIIKEAALLQPVHFPLVYAENTNGKVTGHYLHGLLGVHDWGLVKPLGKEFIKYAHIFLKSGAEAQGFPESPKKSVLRKSEACDYYTLFHKLAGGKLKHLKIGLCHHAIRQTFGETPKMDDVLESSALYKLGACEELETITLFRAERALGDPDPTRDYDKTLEHLELLREGLEFK